MLTSLSIKGKIFIFDIFPKIFPIDTRIPFLIKYFKQIEIISPPKFSKITEYFSFKNAKLGVLRKFLKYIFFLHPFFLK
jgi:hypothetical protein